MEEIEQQKTTFAACKTELEQKVNQMQSELSKQKTRLRELGKLSSLVSQPLHRLNSEGILLTFIDCFSTYFSLTSLYTCMHKCCMMSFFSAFMSLIGQQGGHPGR